MSDSAIDGLFSLLASCVRPATATLDAGRQPAKINCQDVGTLHLFGYRPSPMVARGLEERYRMVDDLAATRSRVSHLGLRLCRPEVDARGLGRAPRARVVAAVNQRPQPRCLDLGHAGACCDEDASVAEVVPV